MSTKHPGFENVAHKIARTEHVPLKDAQAMLAAATRRASERAKKNNPDLRRAKK